jgi:hypothetical protein
MVGAGLKVVLVASLLASCGGDGGSSGGAGNSFDAGGVSAGDFDPKSGESLDGNQLLAAASHISRPVASSFSNFSSDGSLALAGIEKDFALAGFALADSFDACIAKVTPLVDVVTADGSAARQEYKADWSQCFVASATAGGFSVSNAECGIAGTIDLDCPGMDYTQANGKKISDALKYLANGMAGCKMATGVRGSVSAKMTSSCIFAGTINGKIISANILQKAGFLGIDGSACQFSTGGTENVLKDCFDGSFKKSDMSRDGVNDNELIVHRVKLNGAKHRLGSTSFTSGQTFDFELNNWTGSLTTGSYSPSYILKNGAQTKTGSLR